MSDIGPFHIQTGHLQPGHMGSGHARTDELRRDADARRLAGRTRLRRRVGPRRPR